MNLSNFIRYLSIIIILSLLNACNDKADFPNEEYIQFSGQLIKPSDIDTRGPSSDNIKFDYFQESDNKSYIFYVELLTNNQQFFGTYTIPPGKEGVLDSYSKYGDENPLTPLQWKSKEQNHTFYAWTYPWAETDSYFNDKIDETKVSFTDSDEIYRGVEENTNCKILETFVGCKAGPLSYKNNGEYVNLQFRHLVSKIVFDKLQFNYIREGQSRNERVTGKMTFIGLPSEGIFIRKGENGPIVSGKESADAQYEVGEGAVLYVCPNADLSKLQFRITPYLSSNSQMTEGDFIGDFSSIVLDRNLDDWWVEMQQREHPTTNPFTTIYEGEVLTLSITLRRGKGTTVSAAINSWSDDIMQDGSAYPYPGIYTGSEWRTFFDVFQNEYNEYDEEKMFEMFGYEDEETGTKEYRLYSDLDDIRDTFRFSHKYVMNGMGHTITFTSYHGNNTTNVGITLVKDIFIADTNGNKIYIDENFQIFLVDENGIMTDSGHNLLDNGGLGNNLKYVIDLKTGSFTKSSRP